MIAIPRDLRIAILWISVLLILAACQPEIAPSAVSTQNPLALLAATSPATDSCQGCAQATSQALALTQANIDAQALDAQASATAAIDQANQRATNIAVNSTQGVALTQEKGNANAIQAQVAATGAINRANGLATLNAANSTQNAALTEDAIRQTQALYNLQVTQVAGTQSADALLIQQSKNDLASGTQTAVANVISTQTQSAVATTQWYTDQSRQRAEQRQGPLSFLWMWCLPVFIVIGAGLVLWGLWRWLRIDQRNQRIAGQPIERLQSPSDPSQPQDNFLPPQSDIVNGRYRLTKPDEQMRAWLDEIKRKLLDRDKDDDDNPDN